MSDKNFREDNYLPCRRYEGHDVNENGFSKFVDPENNEFYFAYSENNKVIFRSEGYANAPGRDNGIASVSKNMEDESKHSARILPNGLWVLSLKAGNHQEIARSCPLDSEAQALALLPSKRAEAEAARLAAEAAAIKAQEEAEAAKALALSKSQSLSSDQRDDDYLICRHYAGHDESESFPGFSTFEHGGEFFFAVVDDGSVKLRSERYKTKAARDNGIQSVMKNREIKERFSIEEKRGLHYVVLKAGNHQEIARSCPYKSHAEADAYLNPPVAAAAAPKPKKQDDDYLACKMYAGHDRLKDHPDFSTFSHEGEYYFAMLDADGKVRLRSEGYKSEKARDNGIASVTKNREEKKQYSIEEKMKYFFVVLKAKNHQEIGRSCPYTSHAEADAFINPPVVVAAVPKPKRQDDDYLACKMYDGHERLKDHPDFSTFSHEGEYYFAMLDADGKVRLRSEGYKSEKARDNGIASVTKNREEKKQYSIEEKMKYFFVVLKAKNHQEIGRSCSYTSHAEADAFINPPVVVAAAPKPKRQDDDYLACKMYDGHERLKDHPDFSTFSHEGEHYFAMLDADGKVRLRSEGYKSEKARDNGIASVTKNREEKKQYSIEEKMKYFFVVLKAKNHQEIGRSCPYTSHAEADAFINPPVVVAAVPKPKRQDDDYLACKMYDGHERLKDHPDFSTFSHEGEYYFAMLDADGKVRLRSEGYKSEKARDNGIASVTKNRAEKKQYSIEEKMKYFFVVLKAKNHQEIGRSCPYTSHAEADAFINPPVVVAAAPKPQRKDDDYLACKMYKGHQRHETYTDFVSFEHEGEYFFAMLDGDDKVKLRSERYQSAKARDNGIQSVIKNREIEKRWSTDEKMGYYFKVLKAGNHQEIGRSCPEKDKPMGMWWMAAPAAAMAAAAIPSVKAPEPVVEKDKEDDYLACKEYRNRKVNDRKNNVALFKHKNGQFYFTLYHKGGKVRLRSEGFRTAKERDQELSGVLRYKDNKEMYTRIEKNGYYIDVLKDKTGREVGRSCLIKEKAAVVAAAAPLAAAAAATTVAAAAAAKPKPVKAAPVVAAAPAAASSGGFKWWWLLPLLLLPLLFFLWKGCGKDTATTAVVAPVEATPPPVETPKVAPAPVEDTPPPVVAAASSCDCSALTHPVFNLPSGPAPKALTKLGTSPEFGNVHNLSTKEFLRKLRRAYKRSATDKRFLDGVFKAMGYNGFSDASDDLFTEVTLENGVTGNIGSGPQHKTVYRKLNTQGKDLMAFKIKAENGCDMHFMKTCGNHFFFCPK